MALPALYAAQPDAVLLPRWLEPLARMAGFTTMPFDRDARGFANAVLCLRRRGFSSGVLLTPSFSSALMLRLGRVRSRRGTNTDRRASLLTSVVDRALIAHNHRSSIYVLLTTGDLPGERPVPRLEVPREMRARFRKLLGTEAPLIGMVPGSNAPSRTWPADCFAAVAEELSRDGRVVVFGSSAEAERTRMVARDVAMDLGGRTDLPMLAAGLAECELVISNDTGPLHLAAAVGTRTISLWGAGNPAETGPPPGHVIMRDARLPCLECVKNVCPRKGRGYMLERAYMECMHLITADAIITAARQ
ncbi:MAG: glycosyltransferase family 9 protein [Gemmatimonadota bacterium]